MVDDRRACAGAGPTGRTAIGSARYGLIISAELVPLPSCKSALTLFRRVAHQFLILAFSNPHRAAHAFLDRVRRTYDPVWCNRATRA